MSQGWARAGFRNPELKISDPKLGFPGRVAKPGPAPIPGMSFEFDLIFEFGLNLGFDIEFLTFDFDLNFLKESKVEIFS